MVNSAPLNLVFQSLDNEEPWVIDQKIFHILNTYLQSNATFPPTEAAREIDKLFPLNRPREEDRENEEPESFLFEMWDVVISVVEQIPWDHPGQTRLVNCIRALRDLPGPTTVQMDSWGKMAVWSDLPLLGAAMTKYGPGMRFCHVFFSYCFCV
jgi:hypothetical protein